METIDTFIHSRSSLENHTRFQTKMSKVYTRFHTKTAQKPYPMGRQIRESIERNVRHTQKITRVTEVARQGERSPLAAWVRACTLSPIYSNTSMLFEKTLQKGFESTAMIFATQYIRDNKST